MKMKKLSLVSLAAAAIIVAGITTTFATSAAEDGNDSAGYDVSAASGDAASADVASDEATYYFWDISAEKNKSDSVSYDMSSADIGEDENVSVWIGVDDTNLVLWTYEEFAEYIEYEKQTLPNLIGQKLWEDVDDPDFVWTQEMVDELIQMDEDMLKDIKNGVAVYRTEDVNSELQWIKFSYGQNEGWIRNDFLREAVK